MFKWKKEPVLERPGDSGLFETVTSAEAVCVNREGESKHTENYPEARLSLLIDTELLWNTSLAHSQSINQGESNQGEHLGVLWKDTMHVIVRKKSEEEKKVIEALMESKYNFDISKTNQAHIPHLVCLLVNTMPFKHHDPLPSVAFFLCVIFINYTHSTS